jgi:hypothetical protein
MIIRSKPMNRIRPWPSRGAIATVLELISDECEKALG